MTIAKKGAKNFSISGWLENNQLLMIFIIAVMAITTVAGFYISYFSHIPPSTQANDWGNFGDFFGGVLNPVITFLALIALLISIRFQKKELVMVRTQLEDQTDTAALQRFENTFFSLIELLNNTAKEMEFDPVYDGELGELGHFDATKGRISFAKFELGLKFAYEARFPVTAIILPYDYEVEVSRVNKIYLALWLDYEPQLAPYYNSFYQVLKLIKNHNIKSKSVYVGILLSQLSSHELGMIFYHSHFYSKNVAKGPNAESDYRTPYKQLCEEYGVFAQLNQNILIDVDHVRLYDESAFEEYVDS